MQFEYFKVVQVNACIDIDDVGNCCVLARDDIGMENYIYVHTEYGKTEIISVGPLFSGDDLVFPQAVNLSYVTFDYDVKKIGKNIDKFLNNPKSMITQVELIDPHQLKDRFPRFADKII